MITCREMRGVDKKTALEWFELHYGGKFPEDFLPETGVVCEVDGVPAVMFFVYFEESSSVAVLGHCVFHPEKRGRDVVKALEFGLEFVKGYARGKGKKYVVSIFGRNSINRIADRCGFVDADKIEEKFYCLGGE